MGLWSAQRSDYRLPLVELANTTDSVKRSKQFKTLVFGLALCFGESINLN
jgi:hypothetical protein